MSSQPLKPTQLYAYIKHRLGYGSRVGVSLYELVCLALAVDGKPKPQQMTHRAWADSNAGYIGSQAAQFKATESGKPGKLNPLYKAPLSGNPKEIKRQRKRDAKKLRKIVINDPTVQSIIEKRVRTIVAQKTSRPTPQSTAPVYKQPPAYKPGMGKEFYQTREWWTIRQQVLIKYKAICQCCGATREDGVRIHVDHIKPRSLFPALELDISNLQVLCEPCNIGKSNLDQTDWRGQ
jgi:hypothetical protein